MIFQIYKTSFVLTILYSDKGTENESLFDETSVEPKPEIELKDEKIEDEIDYK